MTQTTTKKTPGVAEVLDKYGHCLDLVGMDPHFHNITVGLYLKDGVLTLWTFSSKEGVEERIREIRDLMVTRGDMAPVEGAHNQVVPPCGMIHEQLLKFLLRNVVEKDLDYRTPTGPITIRDIKTGLDMTATPFEQDGRWIYRVTAQGDAPKPELRIRAMVGGFMRYGDMERLAPDHGSFKCGQRHDQLVRLLMPYARNVSGVEDSLEMEALRGQMTTQTLGFSQT